MPAPRRPPVLLTGFAPFAGEALNPSWLAVRAFDGTTIAGVHVRAVELPTEFGAALPALRRTLRSTAPRLVVAVGLAGGRDGISLERIAINLIDARIPDNAGRQPVDVPVVRGGPAAYFSGLPLKATLAALRRAGIAAHISQTAGTYVCNQVFYGLLHALRRRHRIPAGFVHVPWLPDQAARHHEPGMTLETAQRALRIIVRTGLAAQRRALTAG